MTDKPGIGGYIVAAAAVVVGGCGFVWSIWTGVHQIARDLTQVVVPGSADLQLKTAGDYTVYLELHSVVNGKIYAVDSVSGLNCELRSRASGDKIPLYRPATNTNYTANGRSGRSVLSFRIQAPGTYTLGCKYEDGREGPQTVMAVGNGVSTQIWRTLGVSFFFLFGGLVVGLFAFIWTYQNRLKYKRDVARAHAPPAPPMR
jgi:hypothetical protein